MSYDNFFDKLQSIQQEKQQRNFNAFMMGLENGLIDDLDKAFAKGDIKEYQKLCVNIKQYDIRIFRNSQGKHVIKFT